MEELSKEAILSLLMSYIRQPNSQTEPIKVQYTVTKIRDKIRSINTNKLQIYEQLSLKQLDMLLNTFSLYLLQR